MKIVAGIAIIAAAIIFSPLTPVALFGYGLLSGEAIALGAIGASLLLTGIGQALATGPSLGGAVRQQAAPRQIVYGQTRVSGTIVYMSTTNNGHDLNQVIAWSGHPIQSVDTIYLDGRAAHVPSGGGQDDGGTYQDESGNNYTFGSLLHIWNSAGGTGGNWFSDLGGRDSNWNSSCTLNGIAASYIRCHFDQNTYFGFPQILANVHGKPDIYDPRLNSGAGGTAYTNNAALVIADFLCNSEWGIGASYSEVDLDVLVAAANLCDEQVALANGGTEPRYTINGWFNTDMAPGDVLDAMLTACEGRISYVGGQWKIYPAAWYGSGLMFDEGDLVAGPSWTPTRKLRDKINALRATFICPKYPYAQIGFDQDHKDNSVFSGQWQSTDAPEYAHDASHGYSSDANLAADGGNKLYATRSYRFVTSLGQVQRCMKIYLLRNRQQGSGTLRMSLSAYQLAANDVFQMTFPAFNWDQKYLEVQTFKFVCQTDSQGEKPPVLYCELQVAETDPSVYMWSTAEEKGVENTVSPTIYNAYSVNPPTNLVLESGSDSAVINTDGVITPRIHCTWIEPDDPFTLSGGYVELQWQKQGEGSTWHSAGYFNANVTSYFLSGVTCGQQYNVQIRAVRKNGATSGWMSAGPHTVSTTTSVFSYTNVSGLGSLATRNNVDFSTGDVLNKFAADMLYGTGLTVESLKPAEPGAQQTAGKSIDILADGTIYARIKTSQSSGGAIVGMSYGHNMLSNFGFESNYGGWPSIAGQHILCDGWETNLGISNPALFTWIRETSGSASSGNCNLLVRMNPNTVFGPGTSTCRVTSSMIPVSGNQPLFYGGSMRWDSNAGDYHPIAIGLGISLNIIQRIGLLFYDANFGVIGESGTGDETSPNAVWHQKYQYAATPAKAAYVQVQCSGFVQVGAGQNFYTGNLGQLMADMRFDDLFCALQITNSGMFNSQGSMMASQAISIPYSVTNNSITWTWATQTVFRGDGSTLTVPGGSWTTGAGGWGVSLASSTTYYTYWYIRVSDGNLEMANGGPPPTSPNALMSSQCGLDGRIPLPPMVITTLASSNPGTGNGTGGGAGTCPESAELVDVKAKGQIPVGTVQPGDLILGKSFKTNEDVYRKVLQIRSEESVAWRIIDRHKVSACEPVYYDGQWQPAFRVPGAAIDTSKGTKIYLSVESDQYDEQNYYLVSGNRLIIHNLQINPC